MKNFVILGGGYGGLAVANRLLEGELPIDTSLMLIDRQPYQGLKTEYYALAAGTASDLQIRVAFPTDPRIELKYGDITRIDLQGKLIYLNEEEVIPYDQLVIALGCTDNYHGITGAEQFTESIQSLSSTRSTYQKLNDIKPYGHVNIMGGGLSGVEVAAELRESRPDLNIRIIDRGPRVLSAFPEKLSSFVSEWFHEHHVDLSSHISTQQIEQGGIIHQSGVIYSDVTVWTAGIQPVKLVQDLDVAKDKQGRVLLNDHFQIPNHKDVYVVGDCASLSFSPSAQAAGAQGEQVAEVVQALWKNEVPKLGQMKLKGTLGSLGKKSGFGLMGNRTMKGRVPRLLKMGVLWRSKHHFG
ncbi:FAD-dependent oxidoreductase [Paenibacillus selenitireducens]|uniref:FAD-dependent oxidoreductase n=1 Tax=Paenibacillus selenitireducens TaxID=1324314 RepID=A0A1T2XJZ1_9BACL|nr:NAD(P)/FAD-dependent oxidoreductase [Paenibacillus selenitireducens]OPA80036.1 FAD-dependent oxidoreductase [Paenibacillus selenitireducens]